MSYKMCLEKAGAEVLDFKHFGSYQGTWMAFVNYGGKKGIVEGSYGSCSGCDAFEAEFDYSKEPTIGDDGKYFRNYQVWDEDNECTKEEYDRLIDDYEQKLVAFGRRYCGTLSDPDLYERPHFEARLKQLKEGDWFDDEEKEQINWALNQNW